jgi:hypothetical protein
MNEFKVKRGKYKLAGQDTDVWLVIDREAVLQGHETIAGVILPNDSGKALVQAMLRSGATQEDA